MADISQQTVFLRSLGECNIETPSGVLTPSHEIVFAAALLFALSRAKRLSREAIEGFLWPDVQSSERTHHRLRQTLHILKQEGFPIERDKGFLRPIHIIVADFDAILASADSVTLPSLPSSVEFLPHYCPRISTPYSHWLDERRSEINSTIVRILIQHIRNARGRGQWARVEQLAAMCQDIDPYNEESVLARAESVAQRGGKREALVLLDKYVTDLGESPIDLRVQANVMKRRISERHEPTSYETSERPFVGRSEELALLTLALKETQGGLGQCYVVEAGIGMGKSRLATEFASLAQLRDVEVRHARCQLSDKTRALGVFIDIVPSLRKLRGAIGCSPESLEHLNRLTGVSLSGDQAAYSEDAATISENIATAILDLLDAVSDEQSILLIVDDAQWLDPASSSIVEALAQWIEQRKIMVLLLVRPPATEWALFANLRRVKLLRPPPLSDDESTALVSALLQGKETAATPETVAWIVNVGEGNPFFLGELVNQWIESGRTHKTPPSIVAITDQRLHSLSRPGLQILQTCAILGRYSSLSRIERILEYKSFALFEGLNELGHNSLIRVDNITGETGSERQVVCAHELIGSAALRLVAKPTLVAMHRRVAQILEEETRHKYSSGVVWESANHWERAGEAVHGVRLMTTYADHLMGIGFPNEAIEMFRKALSFCAADAEREVVLNDMISALYVAGAWRELAQSIDILVEIRKAMGTGVNSGEHSRIELLGFEARWRCSIKWRDLLKDVTSCIFDERGSAAHRVRAAVLGLKLATNVGTGDEVDRIYASVEGLLNDPSVDLESRLNLEMVYQIDRGDPTAGMNAATTLVAHQRSTGGPAALVWSLVNAAQAMRTCGALDDSKNYLIEAFALAKKRNLHTRACTVAHHLVRTALAQENLVAAKHWLMIASEHPSPSEDQHTQDERLYYAARIALAEGDIESCTRHCELIPSTDDQSLLRRISVLAIKLRLGVIGRKYDENIRGQIKELADLFNVQCARGGQDFEAFSLYLGRKHIGETPLAFKELFDYVHIFRRERSDPPREIGEVLASQTIIGE